MTAGVAAVLGWLDEPSTSAGIRVEVDGTWELCTFATLAAHVEHVAGEILDGRDLRGSPVPVVADDPLTFLAAYYGVALTGGVAVPVAPPTPFDRAGRDARVIPSVVRASGGRVVLVEEPLVERVSALLAETACPAEIVVVGLDEGAACTRRSVAEHAMVQFTSGSTGTPKQVAVTWENLASQVATVSAILGRREGDGLVSWLPHYHDMGLVGCLLGPIALNVDVWLQRPLRFLVDPTTWIRCLGSGRVAGTAAPCFGYALARARMADDDLDGLDFTNVRACVVGAERVDVAVMDGFWRWLAPRGLRPEAIVPAYGLAEATLAVALSPLDRRPRAVTFDWSELRFGRAVDVASVTTLGDGPPAPAGAICLSGCPVDGTTVRVDGADGPVPPGHLGEVVVAGPQVTVGGELRTGDAGFLVGDELVVLGRIADAVKVRGRLVFAEDLEAGVVAATGLDAGQVVVAAMPETASGGVAVFVESCDESVAPVVASALRTGIGTAAGSLLVVLPPMSIERTSSGKPRRRAMWAALPESSWTVLPLDDATAEPRG